MRQWSIRAAACGLLLSGLLSIYCSSIATRKDFYNPITAELRFNRFNAVVDSLEAARARNKFAEKDRFLYYLDAGLAYHYADQFDSSNARLSQAEIAAEELFTKSISRAAMSLLLNDNVLEYPGEDYEILYTNLFMALNYIGRDKFDDAFVEIKRANLKLEQLEQKYADAAAIYNRDLKNDSDQVEIDYRAEKVRFHNDAFARYLSMHMYAAEGKYDEAAIDSNYLEAAFAEQPNIYYFNKPDFKYYSKDNAVLSVVAMGGLAPVKEALNLRLRTDKDLNLVQIFYTDPERQNTEYGHLPMKVGIDLYFKFAIPHLVDRPSVIHEIVFYVDGVQRGRLQLLEDIGTVARETFKAKASLIYLKTVARALTKALANYKLKKKADDGGLGGWLKKAAIDIGTDITENADLRCARLLPEKIYVGDFEIEPGTYDLRIEFRNADGETLSVTEIPEYRVLKNGLNLVEAISFK